MTTLHRTPRRHTNRTKWNSIYRQFASMQCRIWSVDYYDAIWCWCWVGWSNKGGTWKHFSPFPCADRRRDRHSLTEFCARHSPTHSVGGCAIFLIKSLLSTVRVKWSERWNVKKRVIKFKVSIENVCIFITLKEKRREEGKGRLDFLPRHLFAELREGVKIEK